MSLFRRQSSQRNLCQYCGGSLPAPLMPQGQTSNNRAHSGNWHTLSESKRRQSTVNFLGQNNLHTFISPKDRGKQNSFEITHGPSPHHIGLERLHQYGSALLPIHACCEDGHHQLGSPEDWKSSKKRTSGGRLSPCSALSTSKLLGYLLQENPASAPNLALLSSSQHQTPSSYHLSQ